jgi:hypothetical protein
MLLEACRQGIPCEWICSTRCTDIPGLRFQETHSHGPHHTLPLPQQQAAEVWIVEDEITSGATVKNLISQLQEHLAAPVFRIFSFADSRTTEQKQDFFRQFSGKTYFFHSLAAAEELCSSALPDSVCKAAAYPQDLLNNIAAQLGKADLLKKQSGEHLLVIGEAVSTAALLAAAGVFQSFQHVTLSPWSVDHASITSRMDFAPHPYYLYNWRNRDRPVHLLYDSADQAVGEQVRRRLEQMGATVNMFS